MLNGANDLQQPLIPDEESGAGSSHLTEADQLAIREAFLYKDRADIESAHLLLSSPTQLRAAAINPDRPFDNLIAQALGIHSGLRRVVATQLRSSHIEQVLESYQSNARAQNSKALVLSALVSVTAIVGALSAVYFGSFDMQRDTVAVATGSVTSVGSGACFLHYLRKRPQVGMLEAVRLTNVQLLLKIYDHEHKGDSLFPPDRTQFFVNRRDSH